MYKSQCLFALLVQFLTLVHSWDLAITTGDQIELYTNGTRESSVDGGFRELTALAYDAVHNMLLFVDKQSDNTSIFSYNLDTNKYQHLVRKRPYENIQGIAFDPVKSILFWTDFNERSIYWISLKPGFKNDKYGNLLIKLEDQLPRAIAVDSCRGYVYWTNTNITRATIERARFDGSQREVIVETDVYMPVSLAVDQSSRRLYWADDSEGIHYAIESADLDGKNRKTLIKETQHQPNSLTVSKDSVYWVDWGFKYVWRLPKSGDGERPSQMIPFVNSNKVAFGIVANYNIEDQARGVPECEGLVNLTQNKPAINDTFDVPKFSDGFCLNNGLRVDGGAICECPAGFSGERCELSLCHNFCLNGECSIVDGLPSCRCKEGFEGTRCENHLCEGFCLNNGMCSIDGEKPSCRCGGRFEGQRCQIEKVEPKKTLVNVPSVPAPCNCTSDTAVVRESCAQGWDGVRDPILMALGLLCVALCVVCAALVVKILRLKKRPRIKKRIIVNKNVTPLTARPDQCEITIENCCNMNICETPCFEPRSTIRPTLKDGKPGKEEKRNLIANIEYPEDY